MNSKVVKKKIAVIGLGYVGLPLACAIAKSKKYSVVGFDIDEEKTSQISNRICPIDDEICARDLKEVVLDVSSDIEIIKESDYFILCVPTPVFDNYLPNYGPLISAIEAIAKFIRKNSVVIIESTINPGTCEEILVPLIEDATNLHIGDDVTLAHCPERINPADPKWNIYNIARNVGSVPNEEAHKIAEFYGSFLDAEIHPMSSIKVAESTKIIENTFRDINIAYVNELAQSFDAMGIDLYETIQGASNKPFGFMPHWPGAGVGGHCIAVDPYYLIKRAEKSGFDHKFLKRARQINNYMPKYAVERLADALIKREKSIDTTTVGVLGVSYKPNVSDTRESPALEIITHLRDSGANVEIFDPLVPEYSTKETLEELLQGVDAILLATAHPQIIEKLTPKILKKHKIEVVLDGRNVLDKKSIESEGILYRGIGR